MASGGEKRARTCGSCVSGLVQVEVFRIRREGEANPQDDDAKEFLNAKGAPYEGRLCRHLRNWSEWDAKEFARRRNRRRWLAVRRSAEFASASTPRRRRSRTPHCARLRAF